MRGGVDGIWVRRSRWRRRKRGGKKVEDIAEEVRDEMVDGRWREKRRSVREGGVNGNKKRKG